MKGDMTLESIIIWECCDCEWKGTQSEKVEPHEDYSFGASVLTCPNCGCEYFNMEKEVDSIEDLNQKISDAKVALANPELSPDSISAINQNIREWKQEKRVLNQTETT